MRFLLALEIQQAVPTPELVHAHGAHGFLVRLAVLHQEVADTHTAAWHPWQAWAPWTAWLPFLANWTLVSYGPLVSPEPWNSGHATSALGPSLAWGSTETWISRRALRPYLSQCTGKASPALGTHGPRLGSNLLGDARDARGTHGARSTWESSVAFGSFGASVTHGPGGPRVAHESLLTLGPFLPRKTEHTRLALGPWVPNPSFLSRESGSPGAPLVALDSRKSICPRPSWRALVALQAKYSWCAYITG